MPEKHRGFISLNKEFDALFGSNIYIFNIFKALMSRNKKIYCHLMKQILFND